MNIAVISDLHLGAKDSCDAFGHDDAEFLRFLKFLESNFERIVLLGDIWETLTGKMPWSPEEGLAEARACHPEIAARFRRPKYKYIHGNHDIVTAVTDRAPLYWQFEANGKRLLFTHGHTHDLLIQKAPWLAELAVCLGGWVRRCGLDTLYRLFDRIESWRAGARIAPSECTFQRWAVETAYAREADIIITGHTHIPLSAEHGPKLFMNSGACSNGRFSFAAMDTRKDQYGICHTW